MVLRKEIVSIGRDIKALKVQGATNVAKSSLKALKSLSNYEYKTKTQFFKEFKQNADYLIAQRPTEPALRKSIAFVYRNIRYADNPKVSLKHACNRYFDELKKVNEEIAVIGAHHIPKDSTILTHCHSSTVMELIKTLQKMKKNPHVIVTESRPLLQGKLAAEELSKAGIDVTYIVDTAVMELMRDVDVYLTGADAITSDGDVINKVGTAIYAVLADKYDIPYYVAASTYKFDPETLIKEHTTIEHRSTKEVATFKNKKIKVKNPAFDKTESKYVNAIICEKGFVLPSTFVSLIHRGD
ncbi:MAG: S-methyl-5-thioribose-1-phosphate isomerase [Candidatus Diapherotrites archaeon]|nr:S-methyl-5-thioribose-1-phosphate isomerase [Candidatus Diapherotrites archaeon]